MDQVGKVDIGTQAFMPMPVVLLGTHVAGRPNFMAVGWAARVNTSPPLIAVSVNKRHYTAEALKEGGSFSLNVPGRSLAEKTDYCGLVSGRSVDKSEVFAVFYGTLADAPLIRECPLCLECLVAEVHDLPDHVLCIGEIVAAHADHECLSEGRPDARKINPLILTMPDNSYWALGDHVGRAWGMGKPVKGGVSMETAGGLFLVDDEWRAAYPGASAGVLAMSGLANRAGHPALEKRRMEVEDSLRARFGAMERAQMVATSPLSAYSAYFKRFKKTYPVQLQLESVVEKGKHIPSFSSLVTAMFTAELKNQLLTAGHDLDALELPVRLGVADGSETCLLLSGTEQQLKPGDMYMADGVGVISVVVYGPDRRTRITPETSRALFAVYAPPGVGSDAVRSHLEDIRDNVFLFSPTAEVDHLEVYSA